MRARTARSTQRSLASRVPLSRGGTEDPLAHIPDGFLSPSVLASTAAVSAATLAVAVERSRRALQEREAPVLGAVTAFVFAAQMLNFPLGVGVSAHFLGGVLVAVLLGPWSGMLVMFAVLLVQALLFQDGGVAALGANTLNLGVVGVGGGYLVIRWILALTGDGPRRRLAAAGVAAFTATAGVGLVVAAELAASHLMPFQAAALVVGSTHLLLGLIEAALTVAILVALVRSRPDLVHGIGPPGGPVRRWIVAVTGTAALAAAGAAYIASRSPDTIQRLTGHANGGGAIEAPWLAGLVGVAAAFGVSWGAAHLIRRRRGSG